MDQASSGQANISTDADNELPSYNEIAPDANSRYPIDCILVYLSNPCVYIRFGRWKGWIEKRLVNCTFFLKTSIKPV